METGSLSLREYQKRIVKIRAKLNLEKIYQNDNYLIQTLKRTKRVTMEKPVDKFEQKVQNLLDKIYKEIQLLNEPLIKEMNIQNNIFQSDYGLLLEKFQNNTLLIFQDLIHLYRKKGYKIPSLDCSHNLFKVNPLLEENTNKIIHYFLLQGSGKSKKEMLLIKSLIFIRKLIRLIGKNNNKAKKRNEKESFILNIDKDNNKDNNMTIESLKKSIQKLMKLIEDCKNDEEFETKSNKKLYSKLNTVKVRGRLSKVITNYNIMSPHQRRKSKKNVLEKNIEIELKTPRILTLDDQIFDDSKRVMLKSPETGLNLREIKRSEKTLNTYQYKKYNSSAIKFNNNMETKDNVYYSEKKIEKNKVLYNNTCENFNKRLNININKKKFSQPVIHIANLTKIEKKKKGNLPLFVRTQTNEKVKKEKIVPNRRSSVDKSRNYFNASAFSSKTEFFNFIYKRLKKGNFQDVDKYVKKYLNEVECKNSEEINDTFSRYDYRNFKNNLNDLENYIKKTELDRKTEKIYLNNFMAKRVGTSLKDMRDKESKITKFNKIISIIGCD